MGILKMFFVLLGFLSLGLGIVGIIIPVIPTTPFLLLTTFCFVRGSDKFNIWFKESKIYKNYLESFEKERALTLKTKLSILIFADAMLLVPLIILDNIYLKLFILVLIVFKFYYFIFKIKTIKVKKEYVK